MIKLSLTEPAVQACHRFADEHAAPRLNSEQLEAVISVSLSGLLDLFAEERWLLCASVHRLVALSINDGLEPVLYLHARQNDDESWTVGTPEEFPVSAEYQRRRQESEAAIIRQLQ